MIPRRRMLAAALGAGVAGSLADAGGAQPVRGSGGGAALGPARPFSFESLKAEAARRARLPWKPSPPADPATLQAIDYDAFGQARYRADRTLWGDTPGAQGVRLFPMGRYFTEPVAVHVLEAGQAREVVYSPDLFETPPNHPLRRLKGGGFAGFRLMSRGGQSDWLSFLGASYFRASEPFDQYGASARGLAINSGGPGPEEFPRFSAFWLEQNGPHPQGQTGLRVYALLESASVTGAYRIDCRRNSSGAVQEIEAELHFRAPVNNLGLAPLTSMFWYGENSRAARPDWRPEVHDSDGLELWTGAGERLWRPLDDPPRVLTNAYADALPHGYGLIQRDRAFENYLDDGVFYDKRPSLWVEPLASPGSPWAKGSVRLVQLPTTSETEDNIGAFWTPDAAVTAGAVMPVRYRLNWAADAPDYGGIGRVVATRTGPGGRPGLPPAPGVRKVVIDVAGAALDGLDRKSGVQAQVTASHGVVGEIQAYPVVGAKRWRLMFDISGLPSEGADVRAYLHKGAQALSETWTSPVYP